MPLPAKTVTRDDFMALMGYITLQKKGFDDAVGWANSGLTYVVLLQVTTPEVDLIDAHAANFLNLEAVDNSSNWVGVVNSLNNHVVLRGTTALPAETLSDRLNRWLWCEEVRVTKLYQQISAAAGWTIDWCNVRLDDSDNNSQTGIYVLDDQGNPIAVGCTVLSPYKTWPPPGSGCPPTDGNPIGTHSPV